MTNNWITTEKATIESAKQALANRIADLPIWMRWFRTYDNPHGGGAFGKSKEFCTVELIGATTRRLKVKDHRGVTYADPKNCYFARKNNS